MKLRKPCEHGFYDAHQFHRWGTHPTHCPGGEFLPEDAELVKRIALVMLKADYGASAHPEMSGAIEEEFNVHHLPTALRILDALADQVGEPG